MATVEDFSEPLSSCSMESFIEEELARFKRTRARPCSMQDVLNMLEPWRSAKFIHHEVPVRYAERLRQIERLPGWQSVPEFVEVHSRLAQTFRDIRLVKTSPKKSSFSMPELVDDFTEVVREALSRENDVQLLVARAMHRLHSGQSEDYPTEFVDQWLDSWFLNWIGSHMLLSQYIATVEGQPTGIIDPHCDPAEVCRKAAKVVQGICAEHGDKVVPSIHVESYSAAGDDKGAPRFSYIPGYLQYILTEILKNSCNATLRKYRSSRELQKRPISVLVCADERQVAIRVSDKAGGIPFEVGAHVWSYLYSTSRKPTEAGARLDDGIVPLAGYGVGLPLSRLFARYLRGSLGLTTWPGYGTDIHLFLPRLDHEQVEVVPERLAEDDEASDDEELVQVRVRNTGRMARLTAKPPGRWCAAAASPPDQYRLLKESSTVSVRNTVRNVGTTARRGSARSQRGLASVGGSGGEAAFRFQHARSVNCARFSSDGAMLCTASEDKEVRIYDVATGELLRHLAHAQVVWSVGFSPCGEFLCTAAAEGVLPESTRSILGICSTCSATRLPSAVRASVPTPAASALPRAIRRLVYTT